MNDPVAEACAHLNIQLAETAIERDAERAAKDAFRGAAETMRKERDQFRADLAAAQRTIATLGEDAARVQGRLDEALGLLGELPKSIDQWSFSQWRTFLEKVRIFLASGSSTREADVTIPPAICPNCEVPPSMCMHAVPAAPEPAPAPATVPEQRAEESRAALREVARTHIAEGDGERVRLPTTGPASATEPRGEGHPLIVDERPVPPNPPQPAPVDGEWHTGETLSVDGKIVSMKVDGEERRPAPSARHAFFPPPGGDDCCWKNISKTDSYVRCGQPRSAAVHDVTK